MAFKYAGRRLERRHRSRAYREGRLPESERMPTERWATVGNGGRVCYSSVLEVRKGGKDAADQKVRSAIVAENRRILNNILESKNMAFNITVSAKEAVVSRGRASVDPSTDPLFIELKSLPIVDTDGDWLSDGVARDEKEARAFMAKIYKYAKAGAGTIRCRYQKRTGHVLLQRLSTEWRPLRNSGE